MVVTWFRPSEDASYGLEDFGQAAVVNS
jgi:hypothetical protein